MKIRPLPCLLGALLCGSALMAADIPTAERVGASACPDSIAPIVAPFAMPQLSRPDFATETIDIARAGARPGRKCTAVLQRAIDRLSQRGGGHVVVPAGTWLTGRIELRSGVCLDLAEGAVLQFTDDVADYLPAVLTRSEGIELWSTGACIYARDAHDIGIVGKGILRGPGRDGAIYAQRMDGVVIERFVDMTTPVDSRRYDGQTGGGGLERGATLDRPIFLPELFGPVSCSRILVEGVTFENAIYWNIVPTYCDSVIIRGVTVKSTGGRTDGIDIESSRNVLIEYVTLACGDDCFTMKAGRCEDGMRVGRPTERVVVRHCLAQRGPGGLTCGSETAGWIRDIYFCDCVLGEVSNGFYFKTRRNRGGGVERVTIERVRMAGPKRAFGWDMIGSPFYMGDLANRFPVPAITPLTPAVRDITIRDVQIDSCQTLFSIKGLPERPIEGLTIEGLHAACQSVGQMLDVGRISLADIELHDF